MKPILSSTNEQFKTKSNKLDVSSILQNILILLDQHPFDFISLDQFNIFYFFETCITRFSATKRFQLQVYIDQLKMICQNKNWTSPLFNFIQILRQNFDENEENRISKLKEVSHLAKYSSIIQFLVQNVEKLIEQVTCKLQATNLYK